jgi:hypothetical protein
VRVDDTDLVSGADIGRRLGLSRERVRQLAGRESFPEPLGRLGRAKVWRWEEVERWAVSCGRGDQLPDARAEHSAQLAARS